MLETVRYRPAEYLRWLRQRRGDVVSFGAGSQRFVYLLGPEPNAFVFANDGLFSFREAFRALIPVDGPTSLVVSDGEDHRRRRALVRPGLHHRQVAGYVATIARCADEAFDTVRSGETFDGYALFRTAIRRSTMLSLFGPRMAAQADAVGAMLQPLLDLVDRLPQLITVAERLRTPTWRRAMRARARLDAVIREQIDRVRAEGPESEGAGVLATLVHGRDAEGGALTDREIRDQVVTLIAAGYETTSAAMGWILYALGGHPEAMRRARDEVLAVTGGAAPTPEHLRRLPWLSAVVTESLRLYPPAAISARHVAQEFEIGGTAVRPGAMVIYSPYVTHRSPDVYEQPEAFRPERWVDGGSRPPSEYVPFGGGGHRCIGSTLATTELTTMLARLLTRGEIEVPAQRVRAKSFAAMRPREGVRLRVRAA